MQPITADKIDAVAVFLHLHLNNRVPRDAWARAMRPNWALEQPNHGFMLVDRQEVVGAYVAMYSERRVHDRTERFCNLAAFCVLPAHRAQGLRLMRALTRQPGLTFTDFSPSGNVVGLNERLGFRRLDTLTILRPVRLLALGNNAAVSSEPNVVEASLTGVDRQLFLDHRSAAAARHILLTEGSEQCYVIMRHDRRKRLPIFGIRSCM